MTEIYIATEDLLSEAVAGQIVADVGIGLRVAVKIGGKGSGYLKRKLPEFNELARSIPVLLLTDLDRGKCPPSLISDWCGNKRLVDGMVLRVVVREIEAWLLADRDGFAKFCGAPINKVPITPERLDDPKAELLNLVRRYGSRSLKDDVLPARGSSAPIGLGYNSALISFVRETWSVTKAVENADSLNRACLRLRELGKKM